MSMCIYAII